MLVAVADAGSFSRAAAALDLTQPSLSRQIALLEKEIRQPLFVRTGRGAEPTEAGHLLISHARAVLASNRQILNELLDLEGSPRGRIEIGMPPRIALVFAVPVITAFRARFPRATITVIEGLSLALRDMLIAGRLDMALLFDVRPAPQLDLEPLRRETMMLVGPPGAKLPDRVSIRDLPRYPMVLPSAPNAIRGRVDAALEPDNLTLNVVAEVGAVQTTVALVAAGVGYTVLPPSALGLAPLEQPLPTAPIKPDLLNVLMLALPQNVPSSRLARETASLLRDVLKSQALPFSAR